jgi:hypothetical protein
MSAGDDIEITARMRRLLDAARQEDDEEDTLPMSSMPRVEITSRVLAFIDAIEPGSRRQPPRNAIDDLYRNVPACLLPIMRVVEKQVGAANPMGRWPNVPYHYGMGRIMAYDRWLGQLDEQERAQAIAASRERYEAHYRRSAELLAERMCALGFDLTTINRSGHANDRELQSAAMSVLTQLQARRPRRHDDGWDGPTLGGGRSRRR